MSTHSAQSIDGWPQESREAAQLVIDKYGEPDEASDSQLLWHNRGKWKRIVASKAYFHHEFPVPHSDSVKCVIDYRVPVEKFTPLARFDGSVVVERTTGEVSARCHDEEANNLALNLMHDIVTEVRNVEQARAYYAQEFLDYRRKRSTPYMEDLRFTPAGREAADADTRVLSDQDVENASREGESRRPS